MLILNKQQIAQALNTLSNKFSKQLGNQQSAQKPKSFHASKNRNLQNVAALQKGKVTDFMNRALTGVNVDDGVDTKLLREKLGLPPEEPPSTKNLYLMEDLTETEKYKLFQQLRERLSIYFEELKPLYSNPYETDSVCYHTAAAQRFSSGVDLPLDINKIDEHQFIKALLLILEHDRLISKGLISEESAISDIMSKIDPDGVTFGDSQDEGHVTYYLKKFGSKIFKELYNNAGDMDKAEIMEAIEHFKKKGKIVSVIQESDAAYADIYKLADKYTIRIGNGEKFVASDNVKITFRDPSDNPAWAIWFLDAVPLSQIPDRTAMLFLPKEEWDKYYPAPLENYPIVCHASLWQLPDNQTGLLLHVAWHSLAVTYRWHIDKPLDVARIMFKAASHPAHLVRNFGFAPQIREPGEGWF